MYRDREVMGNRPDETSAGTTARPTTERDREREQETKEYVQ